MRALLLVGIVLLKECGFGRPHRIHTDVDSAIYRILGHPAVVPLSNLAVQLELIKAATPCLINAAEGDSHALAGVQALTERSMQLKPIVRHIVFTITKPTASGKDEEDNARMLRDSTARVLDAVSQVPPQSTPPLHRSSQNAQLSERVAQLVALEPLGCPDLPGLDVVELLGAAKRHAEDLHASSPHRLNGRRIAERFIIHEFIPHSEKLYSISEGLKSLCSPEAPPSAPTALASFADMWRNVHDGVVAAGSAILQKVRMASRAISQKAADDEEARRFSALSKYAGKDVEAKFQKVDAGHVMQRLDILKDALSQYDRHRSPARSNPIANHQPVSLLEAMQIAFEVETVLPHFQYLDSNLLATKNKLRFYSSRFQGSGETVNHGMQTNNKIRQKINNISLQADTDRLLRQVRSQASAILGLETKQTFPERIDLMEPLQRFQQLIHLTDEEGRSERFQSELEGLRVLLRKVHREAERLYGSSD